MSVAQGAVRAREGEAGTSASELGEIESVAVEIQKLVARARRDAEEKGRVSTLVLAMLSAAAEELLRECERLGDRKRATR